MYVVILARQPRYLCVFSNVGFNRFYVCSIGLRSSEYVGQSSTVASQDLDGMNEYSFRECILFFWWAGRADRSEHRESVTDTFGSFRVVTIIEWSREYFMGPPAKT